MKAEGVAGMGFGCTVAVRSRQPILIQLRFLCGQLREVASLAAQGAPSVEQAATTRPEPPMDVLASNVCFVPQSGSVCRADAI